MVLLIIGLLFLFPKVVSATNPTVRIITPPTNIIIGDSFPVVFTISPGDTGISYRYKVVADNNSEIYTQPNTSCDSSYVNCPVQLIGDSSPVTLTAFAKLNNVTTANIKIRIAQDDNHDKVFNSDIITITGITPTSTTTPSPTNTPLPTNTTIPTNSPTSGPTNSPHPTSTITPTITQTPSPSKKPTPTETPEPTLNIPTPEALAAADAFLVATDTPIPTPTSTIQSAFATPVRKNILPFIFISAGGLLLLVPIVITKLPL